MVGVIFAPTRQDGCCCSASKSKPWSAAMMISRRSHSDAVLALIAATSSGK